MRQVLRHLAPSRRRLVLGAGAALSLSFLLLGVAPGVAHAGVIGDLVDTAVEKIFGVEGDWITGTFVQWLIQVPSPGLLSDGGPAEVYKVSRDIGFAAMGAFVTFAVAHYWTIGMTSQGGSPVLAFDGILRTCGAALMILAWPFVIDNGVALSHIASDVLVPGGKMEAIAAFIVGGTIVGGVIGGVPMIIGILVVIAFAVIILIIFCTKLMLGAAIMVIAAGMPLALAAWCIPMLAWIANACMKWAAAIVAIQLAWAVELGVYARIPEDFFTWGGEGAFIDKLLRPLTMLAILSLMLSTTSAFLRLAGYSGGSFLGSMAPYSASSFLSRRLGGGGGAGGGGPVQRLMSMASARREAFRGGGSAIGGSAGGGGGSKPGSGAGPDPKAPGAGGGTGGGPPTQNGGSPGGSAQPAKPTRNGGSPDGASKQPTVGKDGIPMTNGRKAQHEAAKQMFERLRGDTASPRRAGDVSKALDTIQGAGLDAHAVAGFVGSHGSDQGRVTDRMASAFLADGLSPEATNAFRTIGIADGNARAAGVSRWESSQSGGESAPAPAPPVAPQPPPTEA